jgi:hypothetical protein
MPGRRVTVSRRTPHDSSSFVQEVVDAGRIRRRLGRGPVGHRVHLVPHDRGEGDARDTPALYGLLAFSNVSAILDLVDVNDESSGRRLRHDYFALDRLERWGTIAFHVSYGEWIRLFRANGFEILDPIEIRPAEWATTTFDLVPLDWARRWPAEVVWKARRRR